MACSNVYARPGQGFDFQPFSYLLEHDFEPALNSNEIENSFLYCQIVSKIQIRQ